MMMITALSKCCLPQQPALGLELPGPFVGGAKAARVLLRRSLQALNRCSSTRVRRKPRANSAIAVVCNPERTRSWRKSWRCSFSVVRLLLKCAGILLCFHHRSRCADEWQHFPTAPGQESTTCRRSKASNTTLVSMRCYPISETALQGVPNVKNTSASRGASESITGFLQPTVVEAERRLPLWQRLPRQVLLLQYNPPTMLAA